MYVSLDADQARQLKRSYTTRHVPAGMIAGFTTTGVPASGDVVIARVVELGQHRRLESPEGRKQSLFPGDLIAVCFAHRYAPAQYEAVVPAALGACDLVAAGGVAARARCRHVDKNEPTSIDVIGFACDPNGGRINLADHTGTGPAAGILNGSNERPFTIVVCGTSMDSGKTTSAAGIIRGLVAGGLQVGAAKVTGTGAGGDVWLLADSGAHPVFDFTDVGMASTYQMGMDRIVDSFTQLTDELAMADVDVAIIEIADGLFLDETRELLDSDVVRCRTDGIVFAAGDAAGAQSGVTMLRAMRLPVIAVSGLLTAAPLAVHEARGVVDVPVLDLEQLRSGDHDLLGEGRWCSRRRRCFGEYPVTGAAAAAGDAPLQFAS